MFKIFKRTPDEPHMIEATVSNRTIIRVLVAVFVALLAASVLHRIAHSLILVFSAFFLTLALNGPVQAISRRLPGRLRGKRSVATAISFIFVVLLFAGFMASIVPPLIKQSQSFIDSVPQLVKSVHNQNSPVGSVVRRYHLEGQIDSVSSDLSSKVRSVSVSAVKTIAKIGSSLISVLTILVLTFMMLIEGPEILKFFRELIPHERQHAVDRLGQDMYRVIRGYINGQVTLAALAAILITPALFILHISYPIALMVIIFVCGLIPMVGHTIGAVIVTLVALVTSPLSAVIILGYYIFYQQIENYLVQPRIQANSTNMSPLLVFLSVVIGVSFGGLLGGLFAIPVAGCIRILVLDFLIRHSFVNEANTPAIEETAKHAKAGQGAKA